MFPMASSSLRSAASRSPGSLLSPIPAYSVFNRILSTFLFVYSTLPLWTLSVLASGVFVNFSLRIHYMRHCQSQWLTVFFPIKRIILRHDKSLFFHLTLAFARSMRHAPCYIIMKSTSPLQHRSRNIYDGEKKTKTIRSDGIKNTKPEIKKRHEKWGDDK